MPQFNFTIQDSSPFISYTEGLWTEGNPLNDSEAASYDGSFKVTNSSNARATFNFTGTGVSVFGALRGNHGDYSVRLDHNGGTSGNGNGNAFKVDLWHAYGLALEEHTVEITNEPLGPNPYFDVDYISIERVIGQANDTIFYSEIDDTAPVVQYRGSWAPDSTIQSQNFNNTIHFTTTPDSQVDIAFQGCCIELYGLYTNAGYTVSLDRGTPAAMQGVDVDLPQSMWHPQTLLYLMDGLSEGNHIVTLTATTTTQQRPFSFDYAAVRSTQNHTYATFPVTGHKPGLSHNAQIGLIAGFSLGGVLLLGLFIVAYLLRRRRQLRPMSREDLMADPDPFEVPHVSIPSKSHPRAPLAPVLSTKQSMSQLSSVSSERYGTAGIGGEGSGISSGGRYTEVSPMFSNPELESSGSQPRNVHPSPSQTAMRQWEMKVTRHPVPPPYDPAWQRNRA